MLAAAYGFGAGLLPGRDLDPGAGKIPNILVSYVLASSAALIVLRFASPLRWLHFFATDYLISFVLFAGLFLVASGGFARWRGDAAFGGRPAKAGAYVCAVAAAAFVIVVIGLVVTSHVLHMTLSAGRWWRFPWIVLAGLPLFISDELTLRRVRPYSMSLVVALLTRALFLAFLLTGVLIFNRENAFLVLIAPLIVIFWVGLWFATGIVHRRTQDPLAAAVFAALVQGWAFAAWFVTI
jgi:hypothetical protein